MSSAVNDPYTYQNGCLETPEQWHDLGFDEPKSFYLSGVWHYRLMNFTILSQENPQLQGFGTQWTLWCTQAWNICIATGLTHAKLMSLTSPCCSGWPAPMNTPQGQQRGVEQRWVCWLQCLIRKWSCVNHQFQFNSQIAYEPTYMAHDLYYLLLFNYWHWHKI